MLHVIAQWLPSQGHALLSVSSDASVHLRMMDNDMFRADE
jgi:hypothetical protein